MSVNTPDFVPSFAPKYMRSEDSPKEVKSFSPDAAVAPQEIEDKIDAL